MIFKFIRGQGQGHGLVKAAKMANFEVFSDICFDILSIVVDYYNMGQYLNFVLPDFSLSLSFPYYGTLNLTQNAFFTKFRWL